MTSINSNNISTVNSVQPNKLNNQNITQYQNDVSKPLPVEKTEVSISAEGRALLEALSKTEAGKDLLNSFSETKGTSVTTADKAKEQGEVTSFAYGALGIDNPEQVKEEEENTSYTAGQYLKGALTVGTLLLAVI